MFRTFLQSIASLLVFFTMPFCTFAQQKGDIIYQNDFDNKAEMRQWKGSNKYRVVTKDGASALMVRSKAKMSVELPVEKTRGATLSVKVRLKAKNVSTPPNAWNGIKIMLHASLPWTDEYPQLTGLPAGSFDWREEEFRVQVSPQADTLQLVLGLENVKGRVWYDKIEIRILEAPAPKLAKPATALAAYKGHNEPRLRGMMVPTFLTPADIQTLGDWGANHIRWQLSWHGFPASSADTASMASYTNWLGTALAHIDSLLPLCRQLGIKIVIDLHSLPGGRASDNVHKLFREKQWQDGFREVWKTIAQRYKNEPAVWGYDLANEPIEGLVADGLQNWQQLATVTAQDIRTIDATHALIVEAAPAGVPEALVHLKPIDVPGVVYSFHMYHPMTFTHQGISDTTDSVRYPAPINGKEWNKKTIRYALQAVRDWQQHHNTHIYVGEFSAIRWAPAESAYYYLHDCIEVFEEYGWDWAYHAFREYSGWSVEHSPRRAEGIPATPPLRQELMMEWFSKNRR